MKYYLAIDIGASSGRHILSHVESGKIVLQEIHRFDTLQIKKDGYDCWDIDYLTNQILLGIKKCQSVAIPTTIGIDTWGVDYVLLDKHDQMIGHAIAYRDKRTEQMLTRCNAIIPAQKLYERTGIQYQPFNTIYQLLAESPERLDPAETLLLLPEYFNFVLTGKKVSEYTNATNSNLVNAYTKTWDSTILKQLEVPTKLFQPLQMPTTVVGAFSAEIEQQIGFQSTVILPATHDTASAFLAVPTQEKNSVFISSGTWSLIGVENDEPITTESSRLYNFTNEGGAWYRYRYLKNIMGLWIIQSIRRELNGEHYIQNTVSDTTRHTKKWSFDDLVHAAQQAKHFQTIIDVDDPSFLAPESMIDAITVYCQAHQLTAPRTIGELMQCVYLSLTQKYVNTIVQLQEMTNKTFTSIHIVGGGSKDSYINQLLANATSLPVLAGPTEGSALGNVLIQMIAAGDFKDLNTARQAISNSFPIQTILPNKGGF